MVELARLEIQPDRFIETDIKGYSRADIYRKAMNWAMQVLSDELGWGAMNVSADAASASFAYEFRLAYGNEYAKLTLIPKYVD